MASAPLINYQANAGLALQAHGSLIVAAANANGNGGNVQGATVTITLSAADAATVKLTGAQQQANGDRVLSLNTDASGEFSCTITTNANTSVTVLLKFSRANALGIGTQCTLKSPVP